MPKRPITCNANLSKLPAALLPLQERPQWCVWRWEQRSDGWSKPPCLPDNPNVIIDTNDPRHYVTYEQAVAALSTNGSGARPEGITYILTKDDNRAAIDVDHCRDPDTGSIMPWARHLMNRATDVGAYVEATPSGTGIRVWGSCDASATKYHKVLNLAHGDGAKIELFCKTTKPLTITGNDLNCGASLPDISSLFDWALDHGKRNKPKKPKPETSQKEGDGAAPLKAPSETLSAGCGDADIDVLIAGPLEHGIDRSAEFARVVGYLHGTGSSLDEIVQLLEANPSGVAQKYTGRLTTEAARVWNKLEEQDGAAAAEDEGLYQAGISTGKVTRGETSKWVPPCIIRVSKWDGKPVPQPRWAVHERIPQGEPVLFWGDGGLGKSTIGMHMSAATVLGAKWLDIQLAPRPALFIDAEESEAMMHNRMDPLRNLFGVTFADMERCGLGLISLRGQDAVLGAPSRHRDRIQPTRLFYWLKELIGDTKPGLVTVASCANVFAGNENNRTEVQQFLQLITELCIVGDATVQLIGHPSVRGMDTGTGTSGTTQWHNASRGRSYLTRPKPDEGELEDRHLRRLTFLKNQYGEDGQWVELRYQNGLFLPVAAATAPPTNLAVDEVFLALLARFTTEGRVTSTSTNGKYYAPRAFALETEAKELGITTRYLEGAMRRLFAAGRIRNENYGRPARPIYKLVVTGKAAGNG